MTATRTSQSQIAAQIPDRKWSCVTCETEGHGEEDMRRHHCVSAPRPLTESPPPSAGKTNGEYEKLGAEIGRLVEQKQAAYGDAFGKIGEALRVLYPSGIPPEKLDDAAAVVRILDKLFRIATDRDALGESPWRDIAGYALLGAARVERKS